MAKQKVIGDQGQELVKMSELSRLSGVPGPTIKHYMREGLLPPPARRTSPNMAYYDPALVPRIKSIKELQRNQYLPLHVIRELLDETSARDRQITISAVAEVLNRAAGEERLSQDEVLESGFSADELQWLLNHGFVEEDTDPDTEDPFFCGDSLSLIRAVHGLRKAGITVEEAPTSTLADYARHMEKLIQFEVDLFQDHIAKGTDGELRARVEAAVTQSDRIVTILRRRALLPALLKLNATN